MKKVDYSTLANPTTGPIFTTLPTGSYLSHDNSERIRTAASVTN